MRERDNRLDDSGPYCIVSGIVGRDTLYAPIFEIENRTGEYTPILPDSGAHRLDWWDHNGWNVIQTMYFDPVFERREGLLDYANFFIVTARPEDAGLLTLSIGEEIIDYIGAGYQPPTVEVLSPNGGETLGDSTLITWFGEDPDQDPVTFNIFVNRDGGNWELLAHGVHDSSFMWYSGYSPGTNAGRVKVVVSDSWNTSADSSNGTFVIPAHFPTATIESPQDTATILQTQYISLAGRGSDLEDGNIGYDSLVWSSTLSGALGTGSLIQASNLAVGTQTIQLMVTDHDGNAGFAYTTVIVLADGDQDGMSDLWEAAHHLDSTRNDAYADYDLDELTNQRESQLGTLPDDADTDNDSHSDGYEVAHGSDPLNAGSIPNVTWITPSGGWGLVPVGELPFGSSVSFVWNAASCDDSLRPLFYEVQLDADPNFSNPLIIYADSLTTATAPWQLSVGLTYSWKVKVSDVYGHWIWSPVVTFSRGHNPQIPRVITDLICQKRDTAIYLHWSPVTSDTFGNPVTPSYYIIYTAPAVDQEFLPIYYLAANEWYDTEALTLEWPTWFYRVQASTDGNPPAQLFSRRNWPGMSRSEK
jgi:hypothetical protein